MDYMGRDKMSQFELIEAKKMLYGLLLSKDKNKLTDSEIKIMYELTFDNDIQDILRKEFQK